MSFSRLALRLAAYEALCPYASRAAVAASPPTTPAWPTIAGANVYDSRIDPIEGSDSYEAFVQEIEGSPLVVLYTDDQETSPTSGEYPADMEIADLTVVLMIASVGAVTATETDGQTAEVSAAITDPQREALLDLLEAQVRQILDPQAPNSVAPAGPWLSVVRELHHVHSVPERSSDKTVRVAQRGVRFRFRVSQTIWPAPNTTPTGINLLPQPLLNVANGLNAASPSYQMLAAYAAYLANPPTLNALLDIRLNVNVNRQASPTDPAGSDSDVVGDVPFPATPLPLLNFLWRPVAQWLSSWFE